MKIHRERCHHKDEPGEHGAHMKDMRCRCICTCPEADAPKAIITTYSVDDFYKALGGRTFKYKLVHGKGKGNTGSMGVDVFDDRNVIEAMAERGYAYVGLNHNDYNREELQGAPLFRGLCGPMWDGDQWIRYETTEMNDALSR